MLEEQKFLARRVIERLRDGLFDPVAVDQLTAEKQSIQKRFSKSLQDLEKNQGEHLCLCGSYGQGKSHTLLHLSQQALREGYATSIVQLDFREVPFDQFSIVYQNIMKTLLLPDSQTFPQAWKEKGDKEFLESLDMMPHRFRMILTAMLKKTKQLTPKEKALKKHQDYQPKEYDRWLEEALLGYNIPIANLGRAFKYRGVEGYRKKPLVCRQNISYMQMIESLGHLLKKIGCKGWVLCFDEGEAITQTNLRRRAKSYALLDHFFHTKGPLFTIFAFTEDFFGKVNHEPYEDDRKIFPKNYGQAWKDIHLIRLSEISPEGWKALIQRLIKLYTQAYQTELPRNIQETLEALLQKIKGQETRFKLKSLVTRLDIESQKVTSQ